MRNKSIRLITDIKIRDIIENLVEWFDTEEMVSFVKEIDKWMENQDFTEDMAAYFENEVIEHKRELKEREQKIKPEYKESFNRLKDKVHENTMKKREYHESFFTEDQIKNH